MLLALTVGLLISNSLIAAFSTFGVASSQTRRTIYLVFGVIAGVFSLFIGLMFLFGTGSGMPDLQHVLDRLFGESITEG